MPEVLLHAALAQERPVALLAEVRPHVGLAQDVVGRLGEGAPDLPGELLACTAHSTASISRGDIPQAPRMCDVGQPAVACRETLY